MTSQEQFKREVRERMARTGEKYTTARRGILTDRGPEPHYRFTMPRTIERIDGTERRALRVPERAGPAFAWGYAGSGPLTSAWAVLQDATGDADSQLAIAFVSDNLDDYELTEAPFVITVAEVRAWRTEREPAVRAQPRGRSYSPEQLADLLRAHLESDEPTGLWWQRYRDRHGPPRLS